MTRSPIELSWTAKKIPGNTRSYFSTLLPNPNPTRYPVFCPLPDPILKNPTRWALKGTDSLFVLRYLLCSETLIGCITVSTIYAVYDIHILHFWDNLPVFLYFHCHFTALLHPYSILLVLFSPVAVC